MRKWAFLCLAVVMEVTASLSLKGALDHPTLYILVVIGYAGAFLSLFVSLRAGMQLGVGYGSWAASGVALTAILSMVIFGESITPIMAVGVVMVMAGVLIIELGSQAAVRQQSAEAIRYQIDSHQPFPFAVEGNSESTDHNSGGTEGSHV